MIEVTIHSDDGVFVTVPSARPKQLSKRDRKIYRVFIALCGFSLLYTICQIPTPQIYKTRSPTMTYHIEGDEYRVFTWDNKVAFSVFLLPPSDVFPFLVASLLMLYILRRNVLSDFKGEISESFGILKAILRSAFTSILPSPRIVGKLILLHLAAYLWATFIIELFLTGGSIVGIILSVALSAALSYYIVSRLYRKIEQTEIDFHGLVESGVWEVVLVEERG
jgi:hypothetical protein